MFLQFSEFPFRYDFAFDLWLSMLGSVASRTERNVSKMSMTFLADFVIRLYAVRPLEKVEF